MDNCNLLELVGELNFASLSAFKIAKEGFSADEEDKTRTRNNGQLLNQGRRVKD